MVEPDPEPVDTAQPSVNDGSAQVDAPNLPVNLNLSRGDTTQQLPSAQPPSPAIPELTVAGSAMSSVTVQVASPHIGLSEARTENPELTCSELVIGHGRPHAPHRTAAIEEQSNSTTGSLSTKDDPARENVQIHYKKTKKHLFDLLTRLDKYRAEPLRLSRHARPDSRSKTDSWGNGERLNSKVKSGPSSMPSPRQYPSGRWSVHDSMSANEPYEFLAKQRLVRKEIRPQSSHDAGALERFQRSGRQYSFYDVYDDACNSVSEESDSNCPKRGETRKFTRKGRFGSGDVTYEIGDEMYYFDTIHLDQVMFFSIPSSPQGERGEWGKGGGLLSKLLYVLYLERL
ncbi:unnamed protein product [Strongylus vulgaris]|uniref:Uncharacterized protein n=1 Tax=Strongylus vulgaris TaxID=40348 RepID=A0A3P7JHE9_STRVU|nr:unnamed protein product [Strongylus vulgaris]